MTTITINRALLESVIDELLPISHNSTDDPRGQAYKAITQLREALAAPATAQDASDRKMREQAQPVLEDIEQYRMQMAGIMTAALGYWKEGDPIHEDYMTVAIRDVAKLYAKYDALFQEKSAASQAQTERKPMTEAQIDAAVVAWFTNHIEAGPRPFAKRMRAAIEAAYKETP